MAVVARASCSTVNFSVAMSDARRALAGRVGLVARSLITKAV
jgi:hypothetical protein